MENEIAEEQSKAQAKADDRIKKLEKDLNEEKEKKLKDLNENEAAKYLQDLKTREKNAKKVTYYISYISYISY